MTHGALQDIRCTTCPLVLRGTDINNSMQDPEFNIASCSQYINRGRSFKALELRKVKKVSSRADFFLAERGIINPVN